MEALGVPWASSAQSDAASLSRSAAVVSVDAEALDECKTPVPAKEARDVSVASMAIASVTEREGRRGPAGRRRRLTSVANRPPTRLWQSKVPENLLGVAPSDLYFRHCTSTYPGKSRLRPLHVSRPPPQ